ETIEKRQGFKVAALEEIAFRRGFIDAQRLRELAEPMRNNAYGQYLIELADNGVE
ncbi:glucose-1-phosphate thymidylyltransferase, partial [Xanthomonas citri pv. citri]|nr:glucose-1-phosphate thymidylyltransferase [Xanthomonas citri pv. citri]